MKIEVQRFMPRKIVYTLALLLLITLPFKAQRHEIGLQLGVSNIVGDIGKTNYILQKPVLSNISDYGVPFYGGILYRMNFNPYQTLRFNLGFSHIQFIDALAKENYRRIRKLWGTNSIIEADVIFEYNFFPVNEEHKSLLSPYVFGGIGGMIANTPQMIIENDFVRNSAGVAINPSTINGDFVTNSTYSTIQKITMSIPFGIGLKYKFNYNWALFGEFMFRPTFSDSIDYSVVDESNVKITYNKDILSADGKKSLLQESPYKEVAEAKVAAIIKNRQIGNLNSKDWVNSATIGLSYSFGRPPCYCK